MRTISKELEARLNFESRDEYPGVLDQISDSWRLIVGDLHGLRTIELQQRVDDEWETFIAASADGIIELPDDFGTVQTTESGSSQTQTHRFNELLIELPRRH